MSGQLPSTPSFQACIENLSTLSDGIDENDLPGLAKMHEQCEELACADGAALIPGGIDAARGLVKALEALILGEVADTSGAMRDILRSVSSLTDATEKPEKDIDRDSLSDESVAEKLDRIFEDHKPERGGKSSPKEAVATPEDSETSSNEPIPIETAPDSPPRQPGYESEPLLIDGDEVEMVAGFVEEASEHIEAIEAALLGVERAPDDVEAIDSLFRPFHTIKGAAGFLNLRDIVSLTHEAETLLDQGRKGSRKVTPGLIDLVFEVVDILKVQFEGIREYVANPTGQDIPQPSIETMIANLRDIVAGRCEPVGLVPSGGDSGKTVGENLVDQGAVSQEVVDYAAAKQERGSGTQKIGETLIGMGVTSPKQVSNALRTQANTETVTPRKPAGGGGEQSVRIDTSKLDALVDMVGELVIAQTQVDARSQVSMDPKLTKDVTHATKIVRDVQNAAMAMRMIPIGPTFQKMARLVRDVSRKVGKSVELTISGEDTDLDKNVIQQIGDPLVHMVRNAVDHGIESLDERRAAGKPDSGNVKLSAYHSGGNIVVEISDDGKGLDPKRLIDKGIEKGVVQPDEELTDEQAYNLIFAPGFSTAEQVTGVSGRGVGMDVVRRNIENLRGKCDITSTLGKGSTFSIRLPLTLAIIDGMVLRVGNQRFIIQTVTVEQALRPSPEQITTVQHKGAVLNVRGRLIPLVPLGPLFNLGEDIDPCNAMVVIAQHAGGEIGLIVDELLGQQQVVIKSLGEKFGALRGISGAAILGDGQVGLILDVAGIVVAHEASRLSEIRPVLDSQTMPSECSSTSPDSPGDRVLVAEGATSLSS
jgi:two-component system, chemotaxis family, sensor kinase CheA